MRQIRLVFATAIASTITVWQPALAEGDAEAGKQAFRKCMACHEAESDRNKVGPTLQGVVGRTAGTVESFKSRYSSAMVEAGEEGLVWNEETIAAYLRDPKGFIPKNKMAFPGVKDDQEIADIIAYLEANSQP